MVMILNIYGNFKDIEWIPIISIMILIGMAKGLLTYYIKLKNIKGKKTKIIISVLVGILYSLIPLWVWVLILILKNILIYGFGYSNSDSISRSIEKADLDKKYGLGEYFFDNIFHIKK